MKCILIIYLVLSLGCGAGCSAVRDNLSGNPHISLSIPDEGRQSVDEVVETDSIRDDAPNDPLLMNAIKQSETGELYATDVISASEVVAKFKSVAERRGQISISFDIKVPSQVVNSRWQLKFYPKVFAGNDTLRLDPVFITGKDYRKGQLRGYQKYRDFISSIVLDSTYFVRKDLLEIFIERNYPEIYAMKTDTSVVGECSGARWKISEREIVRHYTKTYLKNRHRRRWENRDRMFRKYVKDPVSRTVRLDSVVEGNGSVTCSYSQTLKAQRDVRKMLLVVEGSLYEDGEYKSGLPLDDTLEYYVTSLSGLMDNTEKKKMKVISRMVCDSTLAFINFRSGESHIDTTYDSNASELHRVADCIDAVISKDSLLLDSLVITASCSPEGGYLYNRKLALQRSWAIGEYVRRYVPDSLAGRLRTRSIPENWPQLEKCIRNDTSILRERKSYYMRILAGAGDSPDMVEQEMCGEKEYAYIRTKIYPLLRSVSFAFHLHRADMQRDTVHTTETDTVYMNGLKAMRRMDYKSAVSCLRQYGDFNSALAYVLADYNHSALKVLCRLDADNAKVAYLKAIVYARLGFEGEACRFYAKSVELDPAMRFRANLDPELSLLTNKTI